MAVSVSSTRPKRNGLDDKVIRALIGMEPSVSRRPFLKPCSSDDLALRGRVFRVAQRYFEYDALPAAEGGDHYGVSDTVGS